MKRLWEIWWALLRNGFASAVAYRAEFLVWFLSTNMPLVMWLLFSSVAEEAPIGRYGPAEFGAYFLITLIVRLLTGAWVAWELNEEVRTGVLAQRLMRPLHPFASYAAENIAAFPLRIAMLVPIVSVTAVYMGRAGFSSSPLQLALGVLGIACAWALQFSAQLLVGSLALFWHNAIALLDLWLGLYFAFSGYLMPLDLFPPWLHDIARATPFPYLIGHSVEALLGTVDLETTLHGTMVQLAYLGAFATAAFVLFRLGLKRYQAFGG